MLIVVDFDGTITERDTLAWIVRRHAPEAFAEAERGLLGGTMTLQEALRLEFEGIRGDHDALVAEAVACAAVRAGFRDFVAAARRAGHRVVVVSSGFTAIIRPVLEREGLADLEVLAHDVRFSPDGTRVMLRGGDDCDECGEACKRAVVRDLGRGPVAYVGDGYSDRCAALAADIRFATDGLARYLDGEGVAYVAFADFHDVRAALLEAA